MLLIQLQYMLPTNNNNIKEFYYDEIYRDISPLEFLIKNGVKVQQWIG